VRTPDRADLQQRATADRSSAAQSMNPRLAMSLAALVTLLLLTAADAAYGLGVLRWAGIFSLTGAVLKPFVVARRARWIGVRAATGAAFRRRSNAAEGAVLR
jgi:fatty acid desaturase